MQKTVDLKKVFGVTLTYETEQASNLTFEMEMELEPGGKSAMHVHPQFDEFYYIKQGEIQIHLHGQWHRIWAGRDWHVPKGAKHAFRNIKEEKVVAVNKHIPGLRTQEYLETMHRLIADGKITGTEGFKNKIYLSLHAERYPDVVILRQPPNILIKATALLGKLLGYKI